MSNYGHDHEEVKRIDDPTDIPSQPESPVKDVTGSSATFGEPNPFERVEPEDVMSQFKEEIQNKFHNIWKKTFK